MRSALVFLVAPVAAACGGAATSPAPATPAPAPAAAACPASAPDDGAWRAPLDRLVGDWTFEGTAGGEPVSWVETCRWIPESTFLACKTPGEASTTIMGFEPHTGRYAHYGISGKGVPNVVRGGAMDGETWRFASERERVLLTFTEAGFDFVSERLAADGGWAVAVQGRFTRVR